MILHIYTGVFSLQGSHKSSLFNPHNPVTGMTRPTSLANKAQDTKCFVHGCQVVSDKGGTHPSLISGRKDVKLEVKGGEQGNVPGPAESSTGLGGACGGRTPLPLPRQLSGGALS